MKIVMQQATNWYQIRFYSSLFELDEAPLLFCFPHEEIYMDHVHSLNRIHRIQLL